MSEHRPAGAQETLAALRQIAQQPSSNGSLVFNVMHVSLTERSIYRSGMSTSLVVPAGVLETLASTGHIRWTSRGMGVDTFVLVTMD